MRPTKWDVQIAGMIFQTCSRFYLVALHLLTCFRLGNVMKPMYFL
ncbi:DUF6783 domain-containing protein [Blautia faecis]